RRRVPAFVAFADLARPEHLAAREPVHDRRLPDSRVTEEGGGARGEEVTLERVEAFAGDRAHGNHLCADGDGPDPEDQLRRIVAEVELRQDDHGRGAALPRDGEEPLYLPQVQP